MSWLLLILLFPYIITILLIAVYRAGSETYCRKHDQQTSVSVIVPFRNEEDSLPHILNDLLEQTYPGELYNIIAVDDGSVDGSPGVMSEFKNEANLRVMSNSGKGKKSAVRTGIKSSEAELIITVDADCRVGKDWLSTIVSFYNETGAEMVICPVKIEETKGFAGRFQELEFLSLQGITSGTAAMKNPVMCNGANLAFRKETYLNHSQNLHDEILSGDDIFLLHSIKKEKRNAIRFLNSKDAVAVTKPSLTIGDFIRQRARWLSKAGYYTDSFTIYLGIVTFVTIITLLFLFAVSLFIPEFIIILICALLLKSMADFIVLHQETGFHGKRRLMWWLFPSQIIYPFYVIAVTLAAISGRDRW